MMPVRIYQPSKTAMQSGKGGTKQWVVKFETHDPLTTEPIMGWIKSYDMSQEFHLTFSSLNDALDFVMAKGLPYTISSPPSVKRVPKNYATNFTCPRVRG